MKLCISEHPACVPSKWLHGGIVSTRVLLSPTCFGGPLHPCNRQASRTATLPTVTLRCGAAVGCVAPLVRCDATTRASPSRRGLAVRPNKDKQGGNHSSSSCHDSSSHGHRSSQTRSKRVVQHTTESQSSNLKASRASSAHKQISQGSQPQHPQPISTRELTSYLKRRDTPRQLLQLVRQYGSQFDHIHIAAALTQLGEWQKQQRITAEDQQIVAQLLPGLEQLLMPQQLQQCQCRQLSNIIWACSLLRYQHIPLFSVCLHEFVAKLDSARSLQDISNVLYALAESQQQLAEHQSQLLIAAAGRQELLDTSLPQNISNCIWAVATLQQQVPEQQLQRMIASLLNARAALVPQDVSNTLWALAKLPAAAAINIKQLQQLELALASSVGRVKPMEVSNTLWACAELLYFPKRLLVALQEQQIWDVLIPAMKPQELANTGLALGTLGHKDEQLMGSLLHVAVERVQQQQQQEKGQQEADDSDSSSQFTVQELCNLCWAAAVLDLQQFAPQVLTLIAACKPHWDDVNAMEISQIQQIHLWLLDCQVTDVWGLSSVLSEGQLQQCSSAWAAQLKQYAALESSNLQADALKALLQLPVSWQVAPAMEQLSEPDGAFSIDISGVTADGLKVAVEVDGPTHFRRPGMGFTGSTQYRNRALAARGYVVISVAGHEWDQLQGPQQQMQYLQLLLQQQMALHRQQQLSMQAAVPARRLRTIEEELQSAARHPVQSQSPMLRPPQQQPGASTTTSGRVRRGRRRTAGPWGADTRQPGQQWM